MTLLGVRERRTEICHRYSIQLKISHREAIRNTMRCTHTPGFCWRSPDVHISHRMASVGDFRGRPHLVTFASIGSWYTNTHSFLNSCTKPIVDDFWPDDATIMSTPIILPFSRIKDITFKPDAKYNLFIGKKSVFFCLNALIS